MTTMPHRTTVHSNDHQCLCVSRSVAQINKHEVMQSNLNPDYESENHSKACQQRSYHELFWREC